MDSRRVPEATRRLVFERDKVCQACGTTRRLALDHIVPWADGGTHEPSNLQVLCKPCNSRKRRRPTVEPPVLEGSGDDPRMAIMAFRVDEGLIAEIDRLADDAHRTRSEQARRMIAFALSDPTIRRKVTKG